ncbi:MAG: glycosyltransferase [Desulfocapsa sp.]|uniref:Glycosyltransferase n=1 Tax=Desulfotalea psychrophila TaxID=84980 RepID=A0ABS3AUT0_9BACT|nr:glycosyltransferase [Desulfocapsa sp.]MBN4068397.1 glycosyltransferase [Desulfotalea psychrophila]
MKELLKKIAQHFGISISRPGLYETTFIELRPDVGSKGNVLLSYVIEPFLLKEGEAVSNKHHNHWLSLQIASTFTDLGYCVDVISYANHTFIPKKEYSFFIAPRTNFQEIVERLNPNCIKILHLDTAHWLFSNHASYNRALALQQRKNVTIAMHKQIESNWAIEHADYCTTNLGNGFNVSTYNYSQKKIYTIPLPTCSLFDWFEKKQFDKCRKSYLWLGSAGVVHKGLDLVLEAFSKMPDYQLTICGPISKEKHFEQAYLTELYHSKNINTIGWVDIESPMFKDILNDCIGTIFPSCAEGGGASVVTCMQAGLIPIVTYESSVEVGEFGVTLPDDSIESICESVKKLSNLPAVELKKRSKATWEFARAHHSRKNFTNEYKKIILEIISQS